MLVLWCWSRWTSRAGCVARRPPQWELSTTHPLRGDEIRAIKAWLVERARMKAPGRSFFLSEQRKPLHRSTVNLMLLKYGEKARLPVAVHPHMLRHACGFALADQGEDTRLIQDYLGHRNISTLCAIPPPIRHGLKSCGDRGEADLQTSTVPQALPKPIVCDYQPADVIRYKSDLI